MTWEVYYENTKENDGIRIVNCCDVWNNYLDR